ncbi:MAG: flippase-like domain-containing protein [Deltaproteobacteria bacterium]|nr:flippase-like domain-containing protein [Deltaproteobacteria bacterium]MCB9785850.1 flippase-like domain-containing protein [Deltaproteobacteria bacterium]
MSRLIIRTAIGLAIGAFFVWLSARGWPMDRLAGVPTLSGPHLVVGSADPAALDAAWRSSDAAALRAAAGDGWAVDLPWILPYLLVLTIIHFLRVIRWKPLLDPIVELDFRTHNRIGAVGFMAMFIMPLRLGELVRPYLVKRATDGVRMTAVLSTVVVERVADGVTVSLVLFGVLFALPASDPSTSLALRGGAVAALAVFLGATVLLIGARWQHQRTVRIVELTLGRLLPGLAHRIVDILDAFLKGLRSLPTVRAFAWFIFLTLVYWGVNGIGVWLMARAFWLPVDLLGAYAMMACVVVGMMIPNSPGNVGSFWYFLMLPLALYGSGHGSTQAIAFGITVWLLQLLQQGIFGAWYMVRGQVAWRRVLEAANEDTTSLSVDTEAALT